MNRRTILFVLLLAALALAGCNAAGTSPTANAPATSPSKQPQKPPAPKPTLPLPPKPTQPPAASPTPAQGNTNGECTLTALNDVTVYERPSAQAQPFGTMPAGMTVTPEYRTPDGWYGFDPGVAQAGNVGIFRMRWAFVDQNLQASGNCDQLPLAPPLPAGVCFLMPMSTVTVYAKPQTNAPVVGTLSPEEYAAVLGRTASGWVRLNLNLGQNSLSGKGWATLDDAGLNGATCDDLPEISGGGAPPPQPPTATPSASHGNGNEVRIQFASGAIQWQSPVAPQASYVFGAAQGQSTEILVLQNGQPANAALALAAPDGQPLQTYNVGRPDWRGVLPQNGDYHLSIAAPNGVSGLTLVVTIYPLPSEPHPVTDTGVGYTLTYDGAYFYPQQAGFFPNEVFSLNLAYDDFFAHTNLSEGYFIMGLEPINDADTCLNTPPEASITDAVDTWRINGVDYRHYTSEDAGAGNIYAADIFRTYVHSRCITVYLFTHSTNINNYDPSAGIHPYDATAVMDQFKRVFFTLQWP